MGDAFDPYREWLGTAAGKPSTHYGLFGIELFEDDTGVIAQAADALRTRIRSIRPGGHLAEWQGLLDEVTAAKACLLNPDLKLSYDAGLRGWEVPPATPSSPSPWSGPRDPISPVATVTTRTAADSRLLATPPSFQRQDPSMTGSTMHSPYPVPSLGQTPASYPPPVPPSPLPAGFPPSESGSSFAAVASATMPQNAEIPAESPSVEALRDAIQSSAMPHRRMPTHVMMALGLPLFLMIALGFVGFTIFEIHQRQGEDTRRREYLETKRLAEGELGKGGDQPKTIARESPPLPLSPSPSLTSGPGQPRPAKVELAQAGSGPGAAAAPAPPADPQKQAALKKALADARTALANRDLATAKKCVEQASQNAQSDDDRNDVTRMDNLTRWVANFWELIGRRMAQLRPTDELEVGNTRVAIVEAGADALVIKAAGQVRRYTVASLPGQLVTALAEQSLAKDAASKVIFGCFLLVDRHGDRQRARRLFAEAARQGENAEPLLPPLDSFANVAPTADAGGGEGAKVAVDPAKVLQAESLVKQRLQADFDAATTPLRKADLAHTLIKTQPRAQDSLETQVALYHLALELAVAAGRPDLVLQAADRMVEVGGGDALETKVTALEELVHSARSFAAHRDIVLSALKLGPQAIALGRAAEANRLARLAAESARKSQNPGLMRQVKLFSQQAAELERQATK